MNHAALDAALTALDASRRWPMDEALTSTAVQKAAIAVQQLTDAQHVFCKSPQIRTVVVAALRLFGYRESSTLTTFCERAQRDLERCSVCPKHYHLSVKQEFRTTMRNVYSVDEGQVQQYEMKFAAWDEGRIRSTFERTLAACKEKRISLSDPAGPGQRADNICALLECLWQPDLLRREELSALFFSVFTGVQAKGKFVRVPGEALTAMYAFCFSDRAELRDWARKCCDKASSRDKLVIDDAASLRIGGSLKNAHSRMQAGLMQADQFWRGVGIIAMHVPKLVECASRVDVNLMEAACTEIAQGHAPSVLPSLPHLIDRNAWDQCPVAALDFGGFVLQRESFKRVLRHPELQDADIALAWIVPYVLSQVGIQSKVARQMIEWLVQCHRDNLLPSRTRQVCRQMAIKVLSGLVKDAQPSDASLDKREIVSTHADLVRDALTTDAELAGNCLIDVVRLDCKILWTDYIALSGQSKSSITDYRSLQPSPIWSIFSSNTTPRHMPLVQRFIETVGKSIPLIDAIEITSSTAQKDVVLIYNRAVNAAMDHFNAVLRDVGGVWAPTQSRELLARRSTHAAVIECLMSPNHETYQEALNLVKEAHSVEGRSEALRASLEMDFQGCVTGLVNILKLWSDVVIFKSAARLVRTTADVLDLLFKVEAGDEGKEPLEQLWSAIWRMLDNAYASALPFSQSFQREELVEFMRDVLECSNLLLAETQSFESKTGKNLLIECLRPVKALTTWLRLNDDELLGSCVKLITDMLSKLADAKLTLPQETATLILRVMDNSKRKKNNVTPRQRIDLAIALNEHGIEEATVPEPAIDHRQTSTTAISARTSAAPSRSTTPVPLSLKALPRREGMSEAARAEYLKNRSALPASLRSSKPALKNASAGVNRKADSSSDDDDSSEDENGLFSVKSMAKKAAGTTKRIMQPLDAPLVKIYDPVAHRKRLEQTLRARTAPDLTNLFSQVLSWDPLHEGKFPPGYSKESYEKVSPAYQTVNQYSKIIEPLFMLECWEHLVQERDLVKENDKFGMMVQTRSAVDKFVDLYVTMQPSDWQRQLLTDPDIIMLWGGGSCCLARVQQVTKKRDLFEVSLRTVPNGPMVKYLRPAVELVAAKIISLTPIQREYASLKALPYYDLCDQIVNGRPSKSPGSTAEEIRTISNAYRVNDPQARAIAAAINSQGGFTLIQGPPGTGKTKTILGMVGALLSQDVKDHVTLSLPGQRNASKIADRARQKVLLCAPSNAAVDEIVLRLKQGIYNRRGEHYVPKIVRMGMSDSINVNVRDVTLDVLLDELVSKAAGDDKGSTDPTALRQQLNVVLGKRDEQRRLLEQARENKVGDTESIEQEIRRLNTRKSELGEQLDRLRDKQTQKARARDIERKRLRAQILGEADVICATLSGSGHELMANIKVDFDTVIIDEACQTTELNALIPLKYGCTKCVMVGDPLQLPPTVLSTEAVSFSYNESLFVRMQRNNPSAVHLLAIQYRMHSSISMFPSKQFYKGELKNGPEVDKDNTRPWQAAYGTYRFFDINSREVSVGTSTANPTEAEVVLAFVERLKSDYFDVDFDGKIGIVTPYKEQHHTLKRLFRDRYGQSIFNVIDFNTIDGFQGQEKEIIILSCVRAGHIVGFLGDERRMNVALTRAKASLFVFGNSPTLNRSKVWRELLDDAKKRSCLTRADAQYFKHSKTKRGDRKPDKSRAEKKAKVRDEASKAAKQQADDAQPVSKPKDAERSVKAQPAASVNAEAAAVEALQTPRELAEASKTAVAVKATAAASNKQTPAAAVKAEPGSEIHVKKDSASTSAPEAAGQPAEQPIKVKNEPQDDIPRSASNGHAVQVKTEPQEPRIKAEPVDDAMSTSHRPSASASAPAALAPAVKPKNGASSLSGGLPKSSFLTASRDLPRVQPRASAAPSTAGGAASASAGASNGNAPVHIKAEPGLQIMSNSTNTSAGVDANGTATAPATAAATAAAVQPVKKKPAASSSIFIKKRK